MKSVILISLATLAYAAIHSWTATLGMKAWAQRRFGLAADRWYRLAYNIFAGISFLPILALLVILPDTQLYMIPFPWVILTSIGQLLAVWIIILGIWQADAGSFLGLRQISGKSEPTQTSELIISGLYRWVRHPLYTGGLLLIWLTPVLSVNLLTLFICLSIYLVVGAHFEEKRLVHEFGDAYRKYQSQVPMLLPNFRKK